MKPKACKLCKKIYEGDKCPDCGSSEATESFKGRIIVLKPEKSEVKTSGAKVESTYKTAGEYLDEASESLKELYSNFEATVTSFGDDVQSKVLKLYIAFKRIKNFACVELRPSTDSLMFMLKSILIPSN